MHPSPTPTTKNRTSYELAGRRLQALIASPSVQKVQAITVSRLEHETAEGWQQLIDEISETAGVIVEALEGSAIRIRWRQYCEA
jgi:hypothetical protein